MPQFDTWCCLQELQRCEKFKVVDLINDLKSSNFKVLANDPS